mgnify:CR=1 FL=1
MTDPNAVIIIIVATIICVFGIIFGVVTLLRLLKMRRQYDELYTFNELMMEKYNKTLHQKKSSEVRLGKIGENLAPFTKCWPWDANNFRFLGSPIDGMQFTEDMIYLVEIKTGKSKLSKKQARCRELVKEGKVAFVSCQVGEDDILIN